VRPEKSDSERLENFAAAAHDHGEVLLVHTRVYALAHYKDVDELKKLSLERVRITLERIHPITDGSHESANIANLLEYVYSHTDPLDDPPEPMRKLVTRFAAFNFNALLKAPEMLDLIGGGGDVVSCLAQDVSRRLRDLENPSGQFQVPTLLDCSFHRLK
jgi:hypothetical protein